MRISGDESKGQTALVLGASGFLGRRLVRRMSQGGARLLLATRDQSRARERLGAVSAAVELITLDLSDPDALREVLLDRLPSLVFHLAAYGVDPSERDEETARRVNTESVRQAAETLSRRAEEPGGRPRLILAGTQAEYGEAEAPWDEQVPGRPTTLYGRTKLAGTVALAKVAKETGLAAVTARIFNVYGPGEPARRLLPTIFAAASHEQAVELSAGDQELDFVYVDDVAEGLWRLAVSDGAPGEIVNFATGTLTRVRNVAIAAAGAAGVPEGRLAFGRLPAGNDRPPASAPPIGRLRARLGWTPPTALSEGIRLSLETWRRERFGTMEGVSRSSESS